MIKYDESGNRRCNVCNCYLPIKEFYVDYHRPPNKDGLSSECRSCKRKAAKFSNTRAKTRKIETQWMTIKRKWPPRYNKTGQRLCLLCYRYLPESNFGISKKEYRGFRTYCKECERLRYFRYKDKKEFAIIEGRNRLATLKNLNETKILANKVRKKLRENRMAKKRRHKAKLRGDTNPKGKMARYKVLTHYGGTPPKCACCGESTYGFLALDHINGGGNKHKKEVKDVVAWIIKNNYPDGFQILCHNCNMAKYLYGECPHQARKRIFNSDV